MEFKELQSKIVQNAIEYGKKNGVDIDEDFAVMKLSEEVGEFFQALLIHRKKCREEKIVSEERSKEELAHELADILGMTLVTASLLDIDLEKALDKKWFYHLEQSIAPRMIEVEINIAASGKGIEKLLKESEFLGETVITDTYYDTSDYFLTTYDKWLRDRDGQFQLKLPLNKDSIGERLSDQYQELATDQEIRLELGIEGASELKNDLISAGYKPIAHMVTTRKKYQKDGFAIDMDSMDFGYAKGEIELMVDSVDSIQEAHKKLIDFANSNNIDIDIKGLGKVTEYIRRNNPEHFQKLVAAGVIR